MMARKRTQRQSLRFVVIFLIAFISDIVVSGPSTPLRRRGRWLYIVNLSFFFTFAYKNTCPLWTDVLQRSELGVHRCSPSLSKNICLMGQIYIYIYIKHGCFLCFSESLLEMQKGTLVKSVMWHSNISITSPWETLWALKPTGGDKMQRSKAREASPQPDFLLCGYLFSTAVLDPMPIPIFGCIVALLHDCKGAALYSESCVYKREAWSWRGGTLQDGSDYLHLIYCS